MKNLAIPPRQVQALAISLLLANFWWLKSVKRWKGKDTSDSRQPPIFVCLRLDWRITTGQDLILPASDTTGKSVIWPSDQRSQCKTNPVQYIEPNCYTTQRFEDKRRSKARHRRYWFSRNAFFPLKFFQPLTQELCKCVLRNISKKWDTA